MPESLAMPLLGGLVSSRWLFIGGAAALLLGRWYVIPIGLARRTLPAEPPAFEPFDPARHRLPDASSAWMRQTAAELQALGFAPVDDIVVPLNDGQMVRMIMMDHAAGGVRAVIQGGRTGRYSAKDGLRLSTRLAGDGIVSVSNAPERAVHPAHPDDVAATLPDVRDTGELLAAFRAFAREAGGEPGFLPRGADFRSFSAANFRRMVDHMLAAGWYRRVAGGYRLSSRAAVVTAWSVFFPLHQLRLLALRRRQDRWLRRHRLPVPRREAEPARWWITNGGWEAVAAAAVVALGLVWRWLT